MPLPMPMPKEAWGFEVRTCGICHERKGGSPFRLCKCQRDERGLGDWQQHLADNKPKWKKGEWVAEHDAKAPRFGQVHELMQDCVTGEWMLNLDVWLINGTNPHRVSPVEGGPTKFEPALDSTKFKLIKQPDLPFKTPSGRLLPLGEEFVHLLVFVNE